MKTAENDLRRAETRLSRASEGHSRAKELVRQRRVELRQIEAKRKQADKEKRKADKAVLEAAKKAAEREQRWAEQLAAVDEAELDPARQACLVAFAKHQALDLELQLAQKRTERASTAGSNPGDREGSDLVIRELEQQTLEAQKEHRRLAHGLARTEEDLANKRFDLYRASL